MRVESSVRRVVVWLLPLVAGACFRVPQQSASLASLQATDVTASGLQMRVYEAGRHFSSVIEAAADTISARSHDPTVRRNALRWKIAAIPLIEEASLRPDPVVATGDLWAFTRQLSDYFDRGDGRDAFGDLQPLAVAAVDTLERLANGLAVRVIGEQRNAEAQQRLRAWADRHPLRGPDLARESILSSNMEALSITETSLTGTVASLQRNLIGVSNRLGYLNEGMLKRVLWQSELTAGELVPPLLDSGRAAVQRNLSVQGKRLLASVDLERIATFADIARERVAVLDRVSSERAAVVDALHQERVAVLAALHDERVATIASMDSVTQRSIDHAGAVAGRLLLLAVVSVAALAAFIGLVVVVVARSLRGASTRGA